MKLIFLKEKKIHIMIQIDYFYYFDLSRFNVVDKRLYFIIFYNFFLYKHNPNIYIYFMYIYLRISCWELKGKKGIYWMRKKGSRKINIKRRKRHREVINVMGTLHVIVQSKISFFNISFFHFHHTLFLFF